MSRLDNIDLENLSLPDEPTPVEEILEHLEPNEEGLYPHEVLLLSYAPKYYVNEKENNYQGFWWYQYGVKDIVKTIKSLEKRGFIKVGTLETAINNEKLPKIKETLKKYNLKTSGKKQALIQRLFDNVKEDNLKEIFTKYSYELTNLGNNVLINEPHILYLHRNPVEGLDIYSLNELMQDEKNKSWYELIWEHINLKADYHMKNKEYGLYRNCLVTLLQISNGNISEKSFEILAEVIYYDLNGEYNEYDKREIKSEINMFFPYNISIATLPPFIVKKSTEYKDVFNISEDQFKHKLIEVFKKIELPNLLFSQEESAEIVLMEMNSDKQGLEKLYRKVKTRILSEI